MSNFKPGLERWVHGLRVPAVVIANGVVAALNAHAQALWQAGGTRLEGRPLHTLLQPRERRARPAARRAGHGKARSGAGRAVSLFTQCGRSIPAELHTLVQTGGRELVLVLEQQGARRRHRDLLRWHAVLKARAAGQASDHERHRRHVSGLLHDHVQQALATAQMDLQFVRDCLPRRPAKATVALEQTIQRVNDVLQATRRIADELCPPLLGDLGLVAALEGLVRRVEAASGLRVERDWADGETAAVAIGRQRASVLYRTAEECLWAIVQALPTATVQLSLRGFGDHGLVLALDSRDAGPVDLVARLAGLAEWVHELHGELRVSPAGADSARMVLRLDLQPDLLRPRIADPEAAALLGLFHRLPVGVIEMDAQGNVLAMNPAAARRLLPVVHPRSLANLVDALAVVLPGLRQALSEATGRDELHLALPDAGLGPLQLVLHPQSGARWLVILS